jgi:hypothetical protein
MKNRLTEALILILLGAVACTGPVKKTDTGLPPFPLAIREENSLMTSWENKPVLETLTLDNMESSQGWKVTGIGELSYTGENFKDGKQSLRFRTNLRDEEHYRKNRTPWGSFGGTQGGNASVVRLFNKPQDWSKYNRLSFWVFVHPTTMRTYCLYLRLNNEGTNYNATYPRNDHFIQDLKPGQWNHVMFEIPHLERNRITRLEIIQMLTGHTPADEGIVTYDIDMIELQKVDADQYEGWTVAPGKISFSHAGYRPGDVKIALAGEGAGQDFQLTDSVNNTVYSGKINITDNVNGKFSKLDFSDFRTPGTYRIKTGGLESKQFRIDDDVLLDPLFKAINFFYCERCGFDVPGIHAVCHTDWQGSRGDEKKIINGGWHDAGDLSQGSWRTAMSVYSMMSNLENIEKRADQSELADRIRNELKWGLDWLLKTRFGEGYHMSFSVMRIYTDNITGTIDDVVTPASNVPWENFLAAAVECRAAVMFEKSDPDLSARARIAAIDDWQAAMNAKAAWKDADYREASWGATSSVLLDKMTGNEQFREAALNFGNLIIKCQEQTFTDSIPVTGYFYENTDRTKVIHNYHAAFEEAPLIGLSMLCEAYPGDESWIKWYSAAVMHSEYFMKRGSKIAAPFDLLPNSVWNRKEIEAVEDKNVREDMLRQFSDGTPIGKDYVLRTFPIYRDNLFHGNTNIHMSGTWALAEASRLRGDTEGLALASRQLGWIFGANPFSMSLMYGEGYDFAPHFAYCLKDIAGSLPVGMDCMSGDMPHWCATNTATSKEIWVEPVNRFLGTVSVLTAAASTDMKTGLLKIEASASEPENSRVSITVTLSGKGEQTIKLLTSNATSSFKPLDVNLSGKEEHKFTFELEINDPMKPWVAVVSGADLSGPRKELTGSLINL